jgi:esterase/lipase superfamily enzyme
VAQSQVSLSRSRRGIRIGSLPVRIDSSLFANSERVAYFIFEGLSKGSGPLTVHLYKVGQCDSSDQGAYLDLAEAVDFYDHWTVGDTTQNGPHAPQLLHAVQNEESFTNDYVLFVHGWNQQPWKRRAFAETAYKRMWHHGFRGRFGLFSWPTEWVPLPFITHLSFDRSELRAWMSAPGLLEVLLDPKLQHYAGRIRVVAHSLGNVVVSEALRLGAETGRSQLVHTYIATQAAVAASAYDPTAGTGARRLLPLSRGT